METRTVEQVESWSSRSVADGYAGLRELSDGEFSGAVRAAGTWLFMLNGRIIGVFEGSLDDFEDASGTAYAAPHPSLPLVFAMQERGGDTRAKYYTNDTPLTEVDDTLTDGKFTGYVELSENVLSGDYYVAYYGGRSMSVAFVGASEQVVTGDEAFERVADEVGIYEVTDVDLEVIDVPEPDEPEDEDESAGAAAGGAAGAAESASDASGASNAAAGAADDAGRATGGASDDASRATAGRTPTENATGGAASGAPTESGASPESGASAESSTSGGSVEPSGNPTPPSSMESTGGQSATDQSSPDRSADRPDATDDRAASTPDRPDAADRPSRQESAGTSRTDSPATDASATPDAQPGASDVEPSAGPGPTGDSDSGATPDRTADASRTAASDRTADASQTPDADRAAGSRRTADTARATEPAGSSETTPTDRDASASGSTPGAGAAGGASSATDGEAEWRETTTIPSLDPDLSDGPDEAAGESGTGAAAAGAATDRRSSSDSAAGEQSRSGARATDQGQSGTRSSSGTGSGTTGSRQAGAGSKDATGAGTGAAAGGSSAASGSNAAGGSGASTNESAASGDAEARVRKLRKQLKQRKQQVEQLKERLSTLESERSEFKRERDALRQEVERLEAKLEGAPSGGGTDAAGRQLTPAEAFEGTNLFVRYRSKGEATLDEAAEGKADRGDVNDNLRLEHHTQFEADDATVDDEPFEAFLADSFEYEFVSWLIEDLLYEIRDTGHEDGLGDLYEAIPRIDRVDLHGSVSAGRDDEDTRQESFDVIVRDRMGDPLVVADLNDSREPTSGEMMGSLVDAASGVTQRHDELAGAFQVTESFFEPEALETAEAATSGGFLSREKRASFVKLSRKQGYHLCLVEARGGDFHLNVPEL